jgi:hypothetical protein
LLFLVSCQQRQQFASEHYVLAYLRLFVVDQLFDSWRRQVVIEGQGAADP